MASPSATPSSDAPSGEEQAPDYNNFMLTDLDTGMKSYVTDQEWVEKPVVPQPAKPDASSTRPPVIPSRPPSQKRARSDELQAGTRTLRNNDHVRVTSHKKRERDFANLYRWQRIRAHNGAIRALEFNRSGLYLATAGEDAVIKIWEIDVRLSDMRAGIIRDAGEENQTRTSFAYISKSVPVKVLKGHTSDITALSWSKNDFLLSASVDKTIRLWHPRAKGCIRRLVLNDIVTCVAFHPIDEQICVSGTADGVLQIWHLKERKCLSSTEVGDLISACLITPDGAWALVGTYRGRCLFFGLYDEIQGEWQFKHTTQMDVRSRRAKNAEGKKICGFKWYGTKTDQVMVTSNDSRLRLYQLDDKSVLCKFFGHQNSQSHLNASFSPGGRYVLCGSETRSVFIWEMDYSIYSVMDTKKPLTRNDAAVRKDRAQAYESFAVQDYGQITAAVFAPRVVPRDALHLRAAFSNAPTSGLVIVTASDDGEIRVFGCC